MITTHYIEEAKQAHQVAFIHDGICLEQGAPQILLDKYQCCTLEEVSYQACLNYDMTKMEQKWPTVLCEEKTQDICQLGQEQSESEGQPRQGTARQDFHRVRHQPGYHVHVCRTVHHHSAPTFVHVRSTKDCARCYWRPRSNKPD